MPEADDDLFGEVISRYTEDDAIADGELVHPYPKRWPWALITRSIHIVCSDEKADGRTYDQRLVPLMLDAIMAAQKENKKKNPKVPIVLEGTVAGTVWVQPNAKGGLTVMKPEDH